MERYRSGHNEAVLKTVCPQGRVGSNPTLSAQGQARAPRQWNIEQRFCSLGEVPKRPKGHPWKGCRSLIAARGFKSLLLRSLENKVKKVVDKHQRLCYYNIAVAGTRWKQSADAEKSQEIRIKKKLKKFLTNEIRNDIMQKPTTQEGLECGL